MNSSIRGVSIALTFVFVTLFNVHAFAQSFNFADIPWGARAQEVRSALISKSFSTGNFDKDGDLPFNGELVGYKLSGFALFSNGGLQKIFIVLATPDNKARSVYSDLRQSLVAKYGKPSNTFEYFQKPYYSGDGYEDQAIRLGKGTFATYWTTPGRGGLAIDVTEKLAVKISYEGPEWDAEADKRKASSRSVL
jgi:hypothetical protein